MKQLKKMLKYYILKGHEIVETDDITEWSKHFENINERIVAKTKIGDVEISTVFLGIDHSFGGKTPIVFETMVFGGKLDQEQERYATYDEAMKGHEEMVKRVKRS